MSRPDPSFLLLSSPYRTLRPLSVDDAMPARRRDRRGSALIWHLTSPPDPAEIAFARHRPPGVALVVILPPAESIARPGHVLQVTEVCRPHSILPHHRRPNIFDLRSILSQQPDDLPGEVVDYLTWRQLVLDLDTRRLIRKTLELSGELTTVNGLARALYLSRRALGRRFTNRGLPVPSHWLHFGRVLRSALRLQDSQDTLFATATTLGYPDGFALSNQMARLVGIRPSLARDRLGWEWIVEEWLLLEARGGGFSPENSRVILATEESPSPGEASLSPPRSTRSTRPRRTGIHTQVSEKPPKRREERPEG